MPFTNQSLMLSCFVYKHFYVSMRTVYWGCPVSTIIHGFISNNSTITHLTGIFWSPLSSGEALDSLDDILSQLRRYSFAVKFLPHLLSEHYLPWEIFKRVFIFLFLKKKKKKDKKGKKLLHTFCHSSSTNSIFTKTLPSVKSYRDHSLFALSPLPRVSGPLQ